jgi:hypothetical protein
MDTDLHRYDDILPSHLKGEGLGERVKAYMSSNYHPSAGTLVDD